MNGGIIFLVCVFAAFAFVNFVLALCVLRTKPYKNVFTAFSGKKKHKMKFRKKNNYFSAIVMPSAVFLSKETILAEEVDKSRKKTERKFKNFSFYNSFLFFVVGNIYRTISYENLEICFLSDCRLDCPANSDQNISRPLRF